MYTPALLLAIFSSFALGTIAVWGFVTWLLQNDYDGDGGGDPGPGRPESSHEDRDVAEVIPLHSARRRRSA